MTRYIKFLGVVVLVIFFISALTGCALNIYKYRPKDREKIQRLTADVEAWRRQVEELEDTKRLLEERLAKEIREKQVKLELAERGLVITFVAEVLFDSGKAKIRQEAYSALDKVASVIKEKVYDRDIGIEGHTDNEPIKYSGWKSNWELSTARATSVLHYLVDNCGLDPKRFVAMGCGEYKLVASNKTKDGRQKNRRVEIIIMPRGLSKVEFEEMERPESMPKEYIK